MDSTTGCFATGTNNGFVRVWARLPRWLDPPEPAESPDTDKQSPVLLAQAVNGAQLLGASDDGGNSGSYEPTLKHGDDSLPLALPVWQRIYGGDFDATGKRLVVYGSSGLKGSTRDAYNEGRVHL